MDILDVDFFALERLLANHLAKVVKHKGRPIDVKSIRQVTQNREANGELVLTRVPVLLVQYDNYSVPESSLHKVRLGQAWTVTTVVENLRDSEGIGAREDATELLSQVFNNVHGWIPPTEGGRSFKPLLLTNPLYEPFYGNRNSYFPLSFTSERPIQVARV